MHAHQQGCTPVKSYSISLNFDTGWWTDYQFYSAKRYRRPQRITALLKLYNNNLEYLRPDALQSEF